MASTYSSTLNLELQATGENSGTWGTITNNNIQKLEYDVSLKAYGSISLAMRCSAKEIKLSVSAENSVPSFSIQSFKSCVKVE